jgi:hypothetical protein
MTNEPSNHIDPAVSWTDEATITLESASPFNAGASERSRPLCPGMNAAPILWSGADRFGREARAGDGGALGGPGWSGAGVAAVRLSLPDARKREDAPTLAAKIVHYTPYLCRSRSICRTL